MAEVLSLTTINLQAGEAARQWAMNPSQPKPTNPYDAQTMPEHWSAWERLFAVAVPRYEGEAVDSSEASA